MDDEEEDFSIIGQLKAAAKHEGFRPDTPEFDRRMEQMKVTKCREMKGISTCSDCPAYESCEIIKKVLRDNAYKK